MVVDVVLMQNWCQMATSGLPFAMKCCIPINISHPDQIFKCYFEIHQRPFELKKHTVVMRF